MNLVRPNITILGNFRKVKTELECTSILYENAMGTFNVL
jgi:hypothetical protein